MADEVIKKDAGPFPFKNGLESRSSSTTCDKTCQARLDFLLGVVAGKASSKS